MSEPRFHSREHRDFYFEMLDKCRVNDSYHRAFFYVMGLSAETRAHIGNLFDFKEDCIRPAGLRSGWQTSGTVRICRMAFNLWNGHTETKERAAYTPYELFSCWCAPYFFEGIRLRYPECCRDVFQTKKAPDMAR